MKKDYIPHSFNATITWMINFLAYLIPNLQKFGISEDKLTVVRTQIDLCKAAHEKAEHPNAGKADRLDRREKVNNAIKAIRAFVNEHLRYNSAVESDDKVLLGLHVPDTIHTPVGAPETWPVATVRDAGPRRVRIDYHDSVLVSRAKPYGVHGAEIRHALLDSAPKTIDDIVHSDYSTRSPHILSFDENVRGKTIYLCLRWENNRGEKGPWGEIVKTTVP
ncbi:MAG: hypothetical protein LBD35_02170 [Prevotellaceae bacterium]|jgi:hypothetical protein|nr:hypothetical protein [Prevotellaceae bacterium]